MKKITYWPITRNESEDNVEDESVKDKGGATAAARPFQPIVQRQNV